MLYGRNLMEWDVWAGFKNVNDDTRSYAVRRQLVAMLVVCCVCAESGRV